MIWSRATTPVAAQRLAEAGGVVQRIGVHVNRALVGLVACHNGLPTHVCQGVDVVGQQTFARARLADVDGHVDIQVTLLGVSQQVD